MTRALTWTDGTGCGRVGAFRENAETVDIGAATGTATGTATGRVGLAVARASTFHPDERCPQCTQRRKMAPGSQPTP